MSYAELLKQYIKNSRYKLEEISNMLLQRGLSASREHLSRLQNGKVPPASDEINTAIAEITGGDEELLTFYAYLEKFPEEYKESFKAFGEEFIAARRKAREAFPNEDDRETEEFDAYWQGLMVDMQKRLFTHNVNKEENDLPLTTYPVGQVVKVPIIGRVKAGLDGAAIQEHIGLEATDADDIKDGAEYRWLQVYGDSMIGEGIYEGDLALVRIQSDVDNGDLAVVIVNGEYGAIKRVYKKENSIVLQSSNPAHPPRIFVGVEMNSVYIFGKVKVVKRKF